MAEPIWRDVFGGGQPDASSANGIVKLERIHEDKKSADVGNESLGILFLIPATPCKRNLGISGTRSQATKEPDRIPQTTSNNPPPTHLLNLPVLSNPASTTSPCAPLPPQGQRPTPTP